MMDAESLQTSGSPRVRCLDVFLVVSVVSLFGMVALLGVRGFVPGPKLQHYEHTRPQPYTSGDAYKMENFAYLRATGEVRNGTMPWSEVNHGAATSVGSLFVFNKVQSSLRPTRTGQYFIYVDLKLTCPYDCSAGRLTLSVGDRLTCTVEIPKSDSTPFSGKCWWVTREDRDTSLVTQMTVEGTEGWTLDEASGQGVFLVG